MYKLDTKAALAAEGGYITEIGKYVGKFTAAEAIVSEKKGTHGIKLAFVADSGQKADLTLWTMGADETQYGDYKILMSILCCLGVRELTTVSRRIKDKDGAERLASFLPELENKPIGLLLETEEWEKQDGSIGTKMRLKLPFQADTELVASEILGRKTTAEQLPKIVQTLKHHPLKTARQPSNQPRQAQAASAFPDDDIPF